MKIIIQVDAASYIKHYEEQEGDPLNLRRILFDDALNALAGLDFKPLADAITNETDAVLTTTIADSYAALAEEEPDDD